MKNEFDIKKLISIQFEEFCRELMMLHIPFRDDIIERFFSLFNEYGFSWKNRYMEVDGKQFNSLFCIMTLIYRASEHGYTSSSFHEHCDDKGPTLIIIKTTGGWIFGGYITKSWSTQGICTFLSFICS